MHTAVRFRIDGGTILGVGNGDPNSHESDLPTDAGRTAARRLFNGLAQVLVQAPGGSRLVLTAEADGLAPARLPLVVVSRPRPIVAPQEGRQSLTEWRQAPPSATLPDLDRPIAEGDMNSWAWLKPGSTETGSTGARYILFRVVFTPRRMVAATGGEIVFAAVAGPARIWLDGSLVHTKTDPATSRVMVPLPAGARDHVLQVLFDTGGRATPFGLAGTVTATTTTT